jgi:hypothetical protein
VLAALGVIIGLAAAGFSKGPRTQLCATAADANA